MATILQSRRTNLYLAGWDVFGKPKFEGDVKLANRMNFPTAKRVAENLDKIFHEGTFELIRVS